MTSKRVNESLLKGVVSTMALSTGVVVVAGHYYNKRKPVKPEIVKRYEQITSELRKPISIFYEDLTGGGLEKKIPQEMIERVNSLKEEKDNLINKCNYHSIKNTYEQGCKDNASGALNFQCPAFSIMLLGAFLCAWLCAPSKKKADKISIQKP